MSLSFFIARRLYRSKGKSERISKLGVNIASIGVMIGLAVMIISVAVVLGFKNEIKSKVVGFGSHIQIVNSDAMQSPDSYPVIATDDLIARLKKCPGVKHVQRTTQKTGIFKTDDNFKGVVLKGVGKDYDHTFIASHIVDGSMPDYTKNESSEQVVISRAIANELLLKANDKVYAYFFDNEVRMRRYQITGIYETNMAQFDNNVVIANINSVNKLNGWQNNDCSNLEITVTDFTRNEDIADEVACLKPASQDANGCFYSVYSIQELYGAIFDWLKLLDLNIWVILALMTCVCCFTMISGLFILILEKTGTIGVLKAMGARNGIIRRVFLHYGVFIIGRGLVLGNILGLALCCVQSQWHVFRLDASSYYVDHVPIEFDWFVILLINLGTLLICTIILVAPTLVVSHVRPVKALKFD